jgi:hypothetical protein
MNTDEFKETVSMGQIPEDLSPPLQALWMEARGEWNNAHKIVQECGDRAAAWVHAYLHRKEGDESNAAYWYARAGRKGSTASFDQEWEEIVGVLLRADG